MIGEVYGTMLVPALAVKDYWERKKVGRVKVKGIELRRPIYLCRRKDDDAFSSHFTRFLKKC